MTLLKTIFLAVTAFWLSGCALFPVSAIHPGMSRDEVVSQMGAPRAAVVLPTGTRLQYSGQPRGQFAHMVDLDASGRVLGVRQVLNERDFSRVVPGLWTQADVLREFGPPAFVEHVASWKGDILTYRWRDQQDMFYWFYLDASQVVQRAHPGVEERRILRDFFP